MQHFRRQHRKPFALWLVLAAMLLRALLPQGFMPERPAGAPGVVLAICYAGPLAKLRPDRELPAAGHAHGDCVFSAAAGPALPSSGLAPEYGPRAAEGSMPLAVHSHLFNDDRGLPPARGPPVAS